jgi:hypothetical protein
MNHDPERPELEDRNALQSYVSLSLLDSGALAHVDTLQPRSGSSALLLHYQVNDFGALEGMHENLQYGHESNTTSLLLWQENILRSWYHQHLRWLSDAERLSFTLILKAPPVMITSFVRRLIQGNAPLGLPLTFTGIEPIDDLLLPMPHDGVGYKGSSSWQPSSISNDICEIGGTLAAVHDAGRPSRANGAMPYFHEFPGRLLEYHEDKSNLNDLGECLFDSNPQSSPRTRSSSTLRCTNALRKLARSVVHRSHTSGCKQNAHRRKQMGIFACTLGCGYQSKRHADLFRHEQTVYPQQFWFCFLCGDVHNPSEKHVFTRDDKIRKHIQCFHSGVLTTRQCEVTGVRTVFPERCELCLHHRHKS